MEVILTENVTGTGYKGDLKNVKTGFFRNYLFPNKLAILATKKAISTYEEMKKEITKEKEELISKAKETLDQLKGLTFTFEQKASDKGTLYGSITEEDILEKLEKEEKMKLNKEFISINGGTIKEIGEYTATIKLTEDHKGEIKIIVKGLEE